MYFPDKLPEHYDDLKKAFLENYLQQKKCIKDPIEIHHIRHRDRDTEDFVRRGEMVAFNHERKKPFPSWKQQEARQKQNFKKGGFRNQQSGDDQNRKVVKFNQGNKEKQSERLGKRGKKEGNLRKGQIAGNPDGDEDGTEGPMIIEAEMGGHFIHHSIWTEASLQKPCRSHPQFAISKVFEGRAKTKGKLASLNRFLSKSVKKSLAFFKTLKKCTKKSDFQWTAEAEMAFKQMKILISKLPMLTAPKEKEELIICLVAAKEAISAVLMMERDMKQVPSTSSAVYYKILSNLEVTGRLLKWSFDLEKHDIQYRLRMSVKWKILMDFIMEHDSGAGLILTNPKGAEFTYALRFSFNATNNEVEYEALIAGLWIAEQMGVKNLQANVDSWLVTNQINISYIAKEASMIKYLEKVRALTSTFKEFSIKQVPRGENKKADALSKMESTSFAYLSKHVLVKELKEKSIDEKEVLAVVEEEGCTWMTPIHEYLIKEILLEEKTKAKAIHRKASRYVVTNRILYKKSFLRPWLCRVSNEETPFSLTYEPKAVIPVDINMPTLRTVEVDMIKNDEALEISLDLFEEKREQAAIQEEKSKAKMEKYYNVRVHNISFKPGDLVYWNNEASHGKDGGKLGPRWEGPYEVTKALGKGAYKLRDRNRNILLRT
nr:reverse transcriptase domain-containing protein [Tanacetum cinerariifolium]